MTGGLPLRVRADENDASLHDPPAGHRRRSPVGANGRRLIPTAEPMRPRMPRDMIFRLVDEVVPGLADDGVDLGATFALHRAGRSRTWTPTASLVANALAHERREDRGGVLDGGLFF